MNDVDTTPKRQRVQKYRNSHSEATTNQDFAYDEIERICNSLGLPKAVVETSKSLYDTAANADLIRGRSIDSIAAASVYIQARIVDGVTTRTLDELANVSSKGPSDISRASRYLISELGIAVEPVDPTSLVERFAEKINYARIQKHPDKSIRDVAIDPDVVMYAKEIIEACEDNSIAYGVSPSGFAASSLYVAGIATESDLTQKEIAGACDVSEVTIRKRYKPQAKCAIEEGVISSEYFSGYEDW